MRDLTLGFAAMLFLFAPLASAQTETSPDGDLSATRTERFSVPRPLDHPAPSSPSLLSTGGFLTVNQDPEGDMPRDAAFLADGSAVVIANRDTDTATFFNVTTKSITHSVPTGDFPIDVAVTPNNQYALLPCAFANSVAVVDVASHTLLTQIPITGTEPYRVEITDDGKFAVVGVINDAIQSSFSVIDLATLIEVASIPTGPQGVIGFFFTPEPGISGSLYTQFAVSSDNQTIVLPDRAGNVVSLFDLTTGAAIATIPTVATGPEAVDISLDGTVAVVSHEGNSQAISVIDLTTQTLASTIATGVALNNQVIRITPDKSHAIAAIQNACIFVNLTTSLVTSTISTGTVGDLEITPDGKFLFVSNFNARVIDIATQTLVQTLSFDSCYDAAMSPTQNRAVALNNRFGEDILLFDVNGAAGFVEGVALSGEIEEGDAPRTLAISSNGQTVVAANNTSRNASIVDVASRTVGAYAPTGERSLGVAITPDGTTAVVCNADDDTVSVIDVASGLAVASLSIGSRPGEVAISPDGQWAYVTTIAGTDRVHFIQLAGSASTVVSSLPTGQMGSIGYTYGVLSGMALSADGSLLVICISFDDQLMVVDTATRTEIARLPTGDFPIRAKFDPNGGLCYVANSFSDNVSVFLLSTSSQSTIGTVGGVDFPLTMNIDENGAFTYVGSFSGPTPEIAVIQNSTLTKVGSIVLPASPRATHYSPLTHRIYAALTDGQIARIDASGATSSVVDLTPLSGSPSDLVFNELTRTAIVAQPGVEDGLDLIDYSDECPGSITSHGAGCPGSGGFTPQLSLDGCPVAGGDLILSVDGALGGSNGLLFFGLNPASIPVGGGCFLNLSPVLPGVFTLPFFGVGPGNGAISLPGTIPLGTPAFALEMQIFVLDPGVPAGFASTAGVRLSIP